MTDTSSPTFDDAENLDSTVEATVDAAPDVEPPPCPGASVPTTGDLRINELLANPPADALGDANRDGTRDAFEDEFVEIVNVSASLLDLSQASLNVDDSVVVQFDELCVPPGEGVVVFGGFRGEGQPVVPRGSTPIVAPTRLGLSNAGAVISISLADGTTLDSVDYTDAPAESLTRAPQLRGGDFVVHSDLPGQRLMSPGICADGSLLMTRCPESEAPTSDTGPPDAGGDGG